MKMIIDDHMLDRYLSLRPFSTQAATARDSTVNIRRSPTKLSTILNILQMSYSDSVCKLHRTGTHILFSIYRSYFTR